ncbi:hypothetical protein [Paraflavitalea sp. CAU 1676]|uniref:hypothetical protein n=1 Tax=Paraflavitalea sp. CAU 1676 TaxID=3032598 RepID=UPI0023DAE68B|nr:hypothetical protein [Paraflavitalea sp. CAU 1676]MDF2193421.1 hypothetical protein [Paraflavitalea sp. CAU 1676]
MKNVLYKSSLAAILLSASSINAQDWKPLGDAITRNNKMAFSVGNNGNVYAAYDNTMNGVNVKTFDGKSWGNVGKPDFSGAYATMIDIATAADGTPYVAYKCRKKGTTGDLAYVEKYNGKEWETVGGGPVSVGSINYITLAFDNNNKLYCAFADYKRGRLAVSQLDNNAWVELASPQDQATCDEITLLFTKANKPVICFADSKNGKKVTVKTFNGTQWDLTGAAPASDKEGRYIHMALDSKDQPVVAYQYTWDGKILVKKFDGKAWVNVGDPVFASGNDNVSLALDAQDSPYVSYHVTSSHTIKVSKFDGAKWAEITAGGTGSYYTGLVMKKGNLYLTFQEDGKGGVVKQMAVK